MQGERSNIIKAVLGGGLIIILGGSFSRLGGFLRQFIIVHLLTPEKYGLFTIGLALLNALAALGNLGYSVGSQRFIAFHEARDEFSMVRGTILSTLRLVLFSGLSIFLILFLLSEKISNFLNKPDLRIPLLIFCALIPTAMLTTIFKSFFLGFRRVALAEMVNSFFFSITSVSFILIGLLIRKTLVSAIFGFALSYLVTLILAVYLFEREVWPILKGHKTAPMGGRLFRFSFPLFLTSVSCIILNQTDTFMLSYFTASESVGFYNAAFVLSDFIAIFLYSLGTVFMPVITGLVATGKSTEAKALYQSVTRWLFILTLPLLLTFFLYPPQVLTLVFSEPYAKAGLCLAILSISQFLNTFLGPNSQALIAFGETKLLFASWFITAVSNIIMNYFFIRIWGINGAAAATGLSLVILNAINSTFLYFKHGVHPFGRKYVVPVMLCFGASALLYLPLRALVNRSNWFVLVCYPLFLLLGIIFTLLTRSVTEEDKLIYAALKSRIRELLKR